MDYWGGACAVTGVAEPSLLRASHIIPWAKCENDEERLKAYNGLLLAAHLDAAFDAGLISFGNNGQIICSSSFEEPDRSALNIKAEMTLKKVSEEHLLRLQWHREKIFAIKS